ncbi:dephospho-CoA kinase [Bacillus altitudinis]|uniref:dephospho-CoA kinase n=1 Tax=Bacillus altitudinis TaxID=293387 RepID=UPI00228230D6|nr:dephospho-CoA kinase [Bacillus altitudinis]MCY7439416.1 dephospho-CoA kinase [Bacillus altitudinis]MEC1142454.1 dephospho-CoA kinase [Bacillus altitudinis]
MKLAITGKLGAGKDEAVKYLVAMYEFFPFTFSAKGKALFYELFPELRGDSKQRQPMRDFINGITELDVPGAKDVWVDYLFRRIKAHDKLRCYRESRVLITDIRKQAEYERARAEGFKILRITAPHETRFDRAERRGDKFKAADLGHPTETALDHFEVDYEVANDGTLDDLYARLDEIMAKEGVE